MGSHRKYPFGYYMEMGMVVPEPCECEIVQYIFTEYQNGASFKELVNAMAKRGVQYDTGKQWNKNMIARILEDSRYIGNRGYPPIITQDQFNAVTVCRNKKISNIQRSEVQKVLRQKCKCSTSGTIENDVLRLLNGLCGEINKIATPNTRIVKIATAARLEVELDALLKKLPVDQATAEEKVFQLAVARYEQIGNEDYETHRLKRVFKQNKPSTELDAKLIIDTVSEITETSDGSICIRLKNNQIIGKG